MRKLTLTLIAGTAALAFGGVAYADQAPTPPPAPEAPQQAMTRADAQQRADQIFDRLDANQDGKLDQADRPAREKARFDRLDTDHNGQLSYAEFTAARTNFGKDRQARADDRGQRFGGRDGHRGGFGMAMRGFGRGGMMRMADTDKDGAITKAEFETAMLQRFDRLDANHDGTVTPDEAKAARDNMRQQWQSRHEARDS